MYIFLCVFNLLLLLLLFFGHIFLNVCLFFAVSVFMPGIYPIRGLGNNKGFQEAACQEAALRITVKVLP